jgi:predicted RNA-binding Zn ribbon-like protein
MVKTTGLYKARKMTEIRLDGGELSLDFVNTIHDRSVTTPEDYLRVFEDLLDWLTLTKALPQGILQGMKRAAAASPRQAAQAFKTAVVFREVLHSVFSFLARGTAMPAKDLSILNTTIGEALGNLRVQQQGDGVVATWAYRKQNLKQALWPIAKSAMDLLLSGDLKRIKECPRCFWLFHDSTKNGRRKWCSMKTCGSIDKSLRYYYKRKSETRTTA